MSALGFFRPSTARPLDGIDVRASFERRDGHPPPAPKPPRPPRPAPEPRLIKGARCIMCDRAQCGRRNERVFRGVCMRCRSSHDQRAIGWAIKKHEEKRA